MRVTQLAISHPVSTIMGTIALLLFGLLDLERLPINLLPEQQFPETLKSQRLLGIPTCAFVNRHAKMGLS